MTIIHQPALQKLLKLIGDDKASLAELIHSFLTEGPVLVDKLERAEIDGDMEGVRRAVHTLKSSAIDFGALDLGEYCATLEAQCRASEVVNLPDQIAKISGEFDSVRIELELLASELA